MTTQTHAPTIDTGFSAQLSSIRAAFANARARRAAYRQTVSELGALSNRELADLGIYRSMIRQIAADVSRNVTAA